MKNKPKLAFVDNSYHKRTKSTIFLRKVLEKQFNIIDVWYDGWIGSSYVKADFLNKDQFDYILFFQDILSVTELRKIAAKIVWVPMFDSGVWWPNTAWQLLASVPLKIISFSRALSTKIAKYGFDMLSLQVYLNPDRFVNCAISKKAKIYFWQRGNFNINKLCRFINPEQVEKVILKIDPDPGYKSYCPNKKIANDYKIEIYKGDMDHKFVNEIMKECNVYVAPRSYEGIGWSFIEAMSMGMAVIAINSPTMNEYIDNTSGFLISLGNIGTINLLNANNKGSEARRRCSIGWKKWEKDKNKIVDFMKSEYAGNNFRRSIKLERQFFFRIKNMFELQIANIKFSIYKKIK